MSTATLSPTVSETTATSVPPPVPIRSAASRAVEVAWFATICSEDYEFLTVPDGSLRSSFAHAAEVVRTADQLGYQNCLYPSGWEVGQDTLTFAAAVAPSLTQASQLVAVRCGELHPCDLRSRNPLLVDPQFLGVAAVGQQHLVDADGRLVGGPSA